jgi:hypothetical protein
MPGKVRPLSKVMVPIDPSRNTSARENQQIHWNMETFAQTLHYRHAQFALAGHDLTDATRSAKERHKMSARQNHGDQAIVIGLDNGLRSADPAAARLDH